MCSAIMERCKLRGVPLMTINRFRKTRDENEPDVVNVLRDVCKVHAYRLPQPLDLLVRLHDGTIILIEVKMKKGKYTPAQKRFLESWEGSPIFTVHDADEACKVVQACKSFLPDDMSDVYQSIKIALA